MRISSRLFCCAPRRSRTPSPHFPSNPAKPIHLIVPFRPAAATTRWRGRLRSRSGRISASRRRRQPPGCGRIGGAELAAKAPPDGYTLFLAGVGSHVVNPNLHARLPYDPVRDFTPITLLATAPSVLVVNPAVPARSVAEFTAYARANPGKLNYASNGNGSAAQLAAAMYESMANVRMVHVPYKGIAPRSRSPLRRSAAHVRHRRRARTAHPGGKLRALAVTSKQRSALLPEVPSLAESGLPDYEAGSWYGVMAPAGTPREIVERLHGAIVSALKQPEVATRLAAEGAIVIGSTPEEFGAT